MPDPASPTRLATALAAGEFVVGVELAAPAGLGTREVLVAARELQAQGIAYVAIPDGALARVRMDPVAVAHLVQAGTSLEAIAHCAARDRTARGLRSHLLGAHALGVRNVLAVTGDPAADGVGLLDAIDVLRAARELGGDDERATWCAGAAVDPLASDLPRELDRLAAKVDAGARFVVSQPVYEPHRLERFLDGAAPVLRGARGTAPVAFVLGVLPLLGGAHAERLHRDVPGIDVPQGLRTELRAAADGSGEAVGLEHARRSIAHARPLVDGIHLMLPRGRVDLCAPLLRALRPLG